MPLVSLLQKQLPFQLRSMTLPPVLLVRLGGLLQSVEVAEVVVAARWGVTFCLVPAKVQMNTIIAGPAMLRPDHKLVPLLRLDDWWRKQHRAWHWLSCQLLWMLLLPVLQVRVSCLRRGVEGAEIVVLAVRCVASRLEPSSLA